MLAGATLHDLERRMIASLPMEHKPQAAGFDGDDDLLDDGPQDPLAGLGGGGGMLPQAGPNVGKQDQRPPPCLPHRCPLLGPPAPRPLLLLPPRPPPVR